MFDFNKVNNFDDHIEMSIPSYNILLELTLGLSDYWNREGARIYDIGCSTGKLLKKIKKVKGAKYIGIDNSDLIPGNTNEVMFFKKNIAHYDFQEADLFISLFTLQFLKDTEREFIIREIVKKLKPGGALIVAEKTYYSDGYVHSICESVHKEIKSRKFGWDDIMKKESMLRENMRPLKKTCLEKELSKIGKPNEFWRCMNFVSYIVIKER